MQICIKGLPPRTITPYYTNQKNDLKSRLQYFDQLSKMLHNAVQEGNNISVRNAFVVQTLTVNQNNGEDKPVASKNNTSDIKPDVKSDVKPDRSIKNKSLNNSVRGNRCLDIILTI